MFGFWLNRRLYENIPSLLFTFGGTVLIFSLFVSGSIASGWTAVSGLALVCAACLAVFYRNKNRNRAFRFSQLWSFTTAEPAAQRYCEAELPDS